MSHPCRMLTDRELANFARFIRPRPQGAFDSARPGSSKPAHLARLTRGVPLSAFGPGGAYDASPEEDLPATDRAVLVALAQELSDEEWMALKRSLCGEGEGTEAEDDDLPDEKRPAPAMDAFMRSEIGQLACPTISDQWNADAAPDVLDQVQIVTLHSSSALDQSRHDLA
eukprot:gene62667-85696_t